jgi:hypothetical protein
MYWIQFRDGNLTRKLENRWVPNLMGVGIGEDFDPRVLPHPIRSFTGVGVCFYFNARVTRTRPEILFIHYFT